jgi:4-hydroxy-tetrahydrodipicolinate synthase
MFYGSLVPLVTPLRDGELDTDGLAGLVEWQIQSGSHGVGVTGTTGEPAALTTAERKRVIEVAVQATRGRVPVLAGTGSVNHAETLEQTRYAEQVGADAALVITPGYIRPSQEGLFQHFKAVAQTTALPVILYN